MPALTVREPILPEDLSLIQDVFDDACDSHRIPKSSEDAAALALILVRQLQKGRRDKATLRLVIDNIVEAR